MRTYPSHLRIPLVAASLLLGACATTGSSSHASSDDQASGAGNAATRKGPSDKAGITRAQLLFEDAVKAADSQKRKGGVDDETLARKFEAVLSANAEFAEADYNLGVIAERRGRKDEAIAHYQAALRKKPSLLAAAENLAVIQQNSGDLVGAVSAYSEISQKHPEDSGSRARLAELYRVSGDLDKAMELARSALVRDPRCEAAYRVMLRTYLDRKQYSMARLVGLRALKLEENDPEIFYGLGLVALEEKQPEKAWVQLEKAVAARPDFVPARTALAKLALQRENYAAAEANLKSLLQHDPKSAETHLNLGVAYKGQGQYDKAMQEYDAAEKLNPDLGVIYLNRGIILHRHKEAPERGLEFYKKYVALSGGEVALPVESSVFALMKEAEGLVQLKQQAAQQAAEAKKLEELEKIQQQKLKEAEEEDKKKSGVQPAEGTPSAQPVPAKGKTSEKPSAPPSAPPSSTKPAKPPASPAPTDEPSDSL